MLLGSRGARMPSEDATGRSAQATLEAPRAPGLLARGGASASHRQATLGGPGERSALQARPDGVGTRELTRTCQSEPGRLPVTFPSPLGSVAEASSRPRGRTPFCVSPTSPNEDVRGRGRSPRRRGARALRARGGATHPAGAPGALALGARAPHPAPDAPRSERIAHLRVGGLGPGVTLVGPRSPLPRARRARRLHSAGGGPGSFHAHRPCSEQSNGVLLVCESRPRL